MNKIKYILYAVLFIFATSSCSDFLDKEPWDGVDAEKGLTEEGDAIAAVNGAYQPLQWAKLYNMRMWTLDIVAGNSVVGAGGGEDGIETVDMSNFITMANNAGVLDMWRGPSPGILRCNFVLKNVPEMEINGDLKNRCIGEAKFLRALYYFIQVRLFGDVPLITEPQTIDDNLKPSRASKEKVYEFIISDLKDAITLLPPSSTYSSSDLGRASKGAAMGLLAKVYLTIGDVSNYGEIVSLCDQVKALGYRLNDDYSDNFNPNKKNGSESLFEVQYYGKTNYDFWSNENQASWLSAFTGPRNADFVAGGYGWNQPTAEFVSQYETGDLRKDKTILYLGCPAFDGKQYQSTLSSTGYNLRKFLVSKSVSPDYNTSPANFVVLRYADILLMKAEALNEQGLTTDAEEPLYEVRKRAGLTNRADIEGLNQEQMHEKIIHERRIELAFEGDRWFDIVRLENGAYASKFFKSIGKLNFSDKYLLFPIPQKEREANENLTQNPGY